MKSMKAQIISICTAVLMIGCMGTASAAQPPALLADTAAIVAQTEAGPRNEAEVRNLSAAAPDGDEAGPDTEPATDKEEGGILSWYFGLFSNGKFVFGFVAVIAIITFVILKTDFVANFRRKHKKQGKGQAKKSHRSDGL